MSRLRQMERPRSFSSHPAEKIEKISVGIVPDPNIKFFKQDPYRKQLKVELK